MEGWQRDALIEGVYKITKNKVWNYKEDLVIIITQEYIAFVQHTMFSAKHSKI